MILPVNSSRGRAAPSTSAVRDCFAGEPVGVPLSLSRLSRAAISLNVGNLEGERILAMLAAGDDVIPPILEHDDVEGIAFSSCLFGVSIVRSGILRMLVEVIASFAFGWPAL